MATMRGSCGASIVRGSAFSGCVIYPVEQGAPVRRSTASFNCKIFGRGSHKGRHTVTYHSATLDNLTRAPDDRRCSLGWYSSLSLSARLRWLTRWDLGRPPVVPTAYYLLVSGPMSPTAPPPHVLVPCSLYVWLGVSFG